MAISVDLGQARSVALSSGPIAYRERGGGDPLLFVHGLLVDADLWRAFSPVVSAAGSRCMAPDWPLGAHGHPMATAADPSPAGIVELIREFLDRLGLDTMTLVANDTGGGLTQLFIARYPELVARVVLTPSDCFEYCFPRRSAHSSGCPGCRARCGPSCSRSGTRPCSASPRSHRSSCRSERIRRHP